MFRNQYLIVDGELPHPAGLGAVSSFAGWTLIVHTPLQAARCPTPDGELLLLGVAVDPGHPQRSETDILRAMASESDSQLRRMEAWSQRLTGRFVIAFAAGGQTWFWGDACHLRPILYGRFGERQVVGSSETMMLAHFGTSLLMSDAKQRFMRSSAYLRNENAWVGEQACDDRIRRLLPNHRLQMPAMLAKRRTLQTGHLPADDENIIDAAVGNLQATLGALSRRATLTQAVTAGWDSRLLLAASIAAEAQAQYYIFERGDAGTSADAAVAVELCKALQVGLQVIRPVPPRDDFVKAFGARHLFARVLPKTANIQYHYDRADRDRVININGNGGEIWRCYYGLPARRCSFDMACHLLGYSPHDRFVADSLAPWYAEACVASKQSDIALQDLLYWEQRMGNWGAQTPFELDIAIEEVSPFNNVDLALSLLRIDARQRCAPAYALCLSIAERMNSIAAHAPVNPHVPRWRKRLARYAMATYAVKRVKHVFA